jgi:hypothetical protein
MVFGHKCMSRALISGAKRPSEIISVLAPQGRHVIARHGCRGKVGPSPVEPALSKRSAPKGRHEHEANRFVDSIHKVQFIDDTREIGGGKRKVKLPAPILAGGEDATAAQAFEAAEMFGCANRGLPNGTRQGS